MYVCMYLFPPFFIFLFLTCSMTFSLTASIILFPLSLPFSFLHSLFLFLLPTFSTCFSLSLCACMCVYFLCLYICSFQSIFSLPYVSLIISLLTFLSFNLHLFPFTSLFVIPSLFSYHLSLSLSLSLSLFSVSLPISSLSHSHYRMAPFVCSISVCFSHFFVSSPKTFWHHSAVSSLLHFLGKSYKLFYTSNKMNLIVSLAMRGGQTATNRTKPGQSFQL